MSIPAIALLGAESTGKTSLAIALAAHLRGLGWRVALVPEVLRGWCEREGRTPRPDEQRAIAEEQARQANDARDADVIVADTTPLMTAVYSDLLFQDCSLYPFALQHQRRYAATLLMGLDLPWMADGLQRDGPQVREPVDARVRAALQGAGLPFQVIHGQGRQRLDQALNAINYIAYSPDKTWATATFSSENGPSGGWSCEACSDPDCEHRLFTRLLAGRAGGQRPY
ncbi:AAA family ATPase [Xylophilus sp. ASV27]|uniref:AAA family ATPase n=1 Tax=Xylophilus sp. ASV27 TaxID=2795129 RepID=UPI0018ED195E|nr:ATP-binding protein [Xylophilus sp. ASV27]